MKHWCDAYKENFSETLRRKGHIYCLCKRVIIMDRSTNRIKATVRGTRPYTVELTVADGGNMSHHCTCPDWVGGEGCKHVWATMLESAVDGWRPGGTGLPDHAGFDEEWQEDERPYGGSRRAGGAMKETCAEIIRKVLVRSGGGAGRDGRGGRGRAAPPAPKWESQLQAALRSVQSPGFPPVSPKRWAQNGELRYVINSDETARGYGWVVEIEHRRQSAGGEWSDYHVQAVSTDALGLLRDEQDRQILTVLLGCDDMNRHWYGARPAYGCAKFAVRPPIDETVLPALCRTGRCWARRGHREPSPLSLEDAPAWQFRLHVERTEESGEYRLKGMLHRDGGQKNLGSPWVLTASGWVLWPGRLARLDHAGAWNWIAMLRRDREIRVPADQGEKLIRKLLEFPILPPLEMPDELRFEEVRCVPRPRLRIERPKGGTEDVRLPAELTFEYDGHVGAATGAGLYVPEQRRLYRRDAAAEAAAEARLAEVGFQRRQHDKRRVLKPRQLPWVVQTLTDEGWHVEAEGGVYRSATKYSLSVSSGIDWFELNGEVDFGGATASLPALIAALRRGEDYVRLGDGSMGLLPEQWLRRHGLLVRTGSVEGDAVRFTRAQAGLLDALLAAEPEASWDEGFARAREELRQFQAIEPAEASGNFVGVLRGYQRDGLGWLRFLRRLNFGGCLADDMGLGKTVQVLAMLEARRQEATAAGGSGQQGRARRPSLGVVPRSLIFNWVQEAKRFTPELRVLDHTGLDRSREDFSHFAEHDLVLTTYGTLRRDILLLKETQFDYVILDEAQAIKNADTASAKAARLLKAGHRLALSGTPIENHLGELWSLLDFLNPGLLGSSRAFAAATSGKAEADADARAALAKALRPFILRRTKGQVASDLPEKVEQTIHCQLDAEQRRLYDELRDHYRQSLLAKIEQDGLGKCKMHVLEALLRLRQAACHPGLIDKTRRGESSAKLESLLPQLREVMDEGHKAIVFSQFTSLLSIVRDRLDGEKVAYEYLDGRTRDRQEKVRRFQEDENCRLFLISLKAGGLGLNLTAAEYVFLLDPWWNPAVEAQAIDRAHRIGQTRTVFAYRLIAEGTVEEKVLELQRTKRDLADAIINADNSLIGNLKREDLELLLG